MITRKLDIRDENIICSVINTYLRDIFIIKVNENIGNFIDGEELIVKISQILFYIRNGMEYN